MIRKISGGSVITKHILPALQKVGDFFVAGKKLAKAVFYICAAAVIAVTSVVTSLSGLDEEENDPP